MQKRKRWYRRHSPRRFSLRLLEAISFRIPLTVSEYRQFNDREGYWVCPRCDITLDREYQAYCDRCGQCLDWELVDPDD